MIRIYVVLCIIAFGVGSGQLNAQIDQSKYGEAEDLVEFGNFHKALEIFQDLLEEFPNNANLNFKIGFCYLNTATEKTKAIPYLEFASKHLSNDYDINSSKEENAPIETLFYLGQAYHVNYRLDDAERILFELKKQVSIEETAFLDKIDHELASCQYARLLMKSPVEMTVSNLGKQINSEYTEHSPVISGDESLLIFTSKREGNVGNKKTDDGQYFEDIFISKLEGKQFAQAKKISNNINTSGHEASIGLSFDGSKLLIYRDDEGNGNIYVSAKSGDDWGIPEPMPATVNSKYRETHASMSFDQSEIYFTSDRKGGFGGLDIYRVRKLPNGNWSRAQNLGPDINTPFDEEGPNLHPDGTSLYFASEGHNTMGGFDIFVSYINEEDDKWLKPENIGYPINTPDDDVYYIPSVDGRRAYYASYANNSLGYYDIFRIDLSEAHVRNQTVISGIARVKSGILLQDGIVSISSMDDDLVGVYTPDQEVKKFLAILPRGKTFKVLFESSNYDDFEKIIKVPEFAYDQSGKVVHFDDIVIGGKDPAEHESVLAETIKTEDNEDSSIDYSAAEEGSINSISGNSKLAMESSAEYEKEISSVKESETANLSEIGEEKEEDKNDLIEVSESEIELKTKQSEQIDKKTKSQKSSRSNKSEQKSRIIYYLLGLLVVTISGFVVLRRRSN